MAIALAISIKANLFVDAIFSLVDSVCLFILKELLSLCIITWAMTPPTIADCDTMRGHFINASKVDVTDVVVVVVCN